MSTPAELMLVGYDYARRDGVVCRDPRYPHSVLMRREVTA